MILKIVVDVVSKNLIEFFVLLLLEVLRLHVMGLTPMAPMMLTSRLLVTWIKSLELSHRQKSSVFLFLIVLW